MTAGMWVLVAVPTLSFVLLLVVLFGLNERITKLESLLKRRGVI